MKEPIPARGTKRVDSKYSISGTNPLLPNTFPDPKYNPGVKRYDNIKSKLLFLNNYLKHINNYHSIINK